MEAIGKQERGNISWDALLRLLEGLHCTLPAPMNSYADQIKLTAANDIPIFCTGRALLRFYKVDENEPQTPEHAEENRMMDERWKHFRLTHVFEEGDKMEVTPCPYCVCKFVVSGDA